VTSLHSHDVFFIVFFVFLKKKKKERKKERKERKKKERKKGPEPEHQALRRQLVALSAKGTRGAETCRDPGQGSRRTLGPFVPEICVCE
jgi:hypothetical protein